jgi:hypothetical protein
MLPIILNRNARGLGIASDLPRTLERLGGCRVLESRTLEHLGTIASTVAETRSDVVALAGGDGTVMEGLSALARAYRARDAALPKIAILPAGTFSTIAKNLGLPRRTTPYAKRVLEAVAANEIRTRPHPTLHVRDACGGDRIGFIFGTGLVAGFFDLYDALPDQGVLSATWLVARLFGGAFTGSDLAKRVLTPTSLRLDIDGRALPDEHYSLVVSSVLRDVGLHVRPTHRAGEDPARIHLVASTRHAINLAMQLPLVMAARPMRGGGHVDALAETFRVTFDGALRSYVLDGDRIEAGGPNQEAWVTVSRGPDIDLVAA